MMRGTRSGPVGLLLAVLLAGFNLRVLYTTTGTLLLPIQQTLGLSGLSVGVLTSLPTLCMGAVALFGSWVITRMGIGWGPFAALLLIAFGSLLRVGGDNGSLLFLGTTLAGLGIALIQVLVPAVVKQHFPTRMALMMGLYTTAMNVGAACGAAFSQPLASHLGGWPQSLGIWTVPAMIAALYWPRGLRLEQSPERGLLPWRNRRGWQIAAFLGATSIPYMSILVWLVPYFRALGWPETQAAQTLTLFTLAQILGAVLVPFIAQRFRDRRPLLTANLIMLAGGLGGLMWAPTAYPWLWVAFAGLGLGASFPITITLPLDYSDSPRDAAQLSAMVFGIGMLLGGPGSAVFGALRDSLGFAAAWGFLLTTAAACLLLSAVFRPPQPVNELTPPALSTQ